MRYHEANGYAPPADSLYATADGPITIADTHDYLAHVTLHKEAWHVHIIASAFRNVEHLALSRCAHLRNNGTCRLRIISSYNRHH